MHPHAHAYSVLFQNCYIVGRITGMFLTRSRVRKPNQEPYRVEFSEYYSGDDLFVGAKIIVNKHKFILIEADEYVYDYMEKYSHEVSTKSVQ